MKLTDRDILILFLPLALTSTMMSITVPVINAGLARLPDPTFNLAVYGLAFSLSIFLESPVFALQQAIVAWYRGSGPYRHLVVFSAGVGLLMMAVIAAVSFTGAARFLFRNLMGAPEAMIEPSIHALRVAMAFPPLVATRLAFQGVLIQRRKSLPIAWGTFIRLIFLTVLILGVCPRIPVEPAVSAMASLAAAVLVETVYVAAVVRRSPEMDQGVSPAQRKGRLLSGRILFLLPLAGTMSLGALTNPIIISFISRTRDAETTLAAYAVISSLVWFLASPSLRYSAVTIALGTTREHLRRLSWFLWRFVGALAALVLILSLTPALNAGLRHFMGLDPALAGKVRLPLILLSMQPLVAGFIAFNQGVLTRNDHTSWVGMGSLSRMAIIFLLGTAGLAVKMDGPLLGGLLLGAAFLAELITLVVLRRVGRRRRARLAAAESGVQST